MAVINALDAHDFIAKVSEARRDFYKSLKTFPTFGKGWLRRVDETEKEALHAT
jgi:lysozyme family protein